MEIDQDQPRRALPESPTEFQPSSDVCERCPYHTSTPPLGEVSMKGAGIVVDDTRSDMADGAQPPEPTWRTLLNPKTPEDFRRLSEIQQASAYFRAELERQHGEQGRARA